MHPFCTEKWSICYISLLLKAHGPIGFHSGAVIHSFSSGLFLISPTLQLLQASSSYWSSRKDFSNIKNNNPKELIITVKRLLPKTNKNRVSLQPKYQGSIICKNKIQLSFRQVRTHNFHPYLITQLEHPACPLACNAIIIFIVIIKIIVQVPN